MFRWAACPLYSSSSSMAEPRSVLLLPCLASPSVHNPDLRLVLEVCAPWTPLLILWNLMELWCVVLFYERVKGRDCSIEGLCGGLRDSSVQTPKPGLSLGHVSSAT